MSTVSVIFGGQFVGRSRVDHIARVHEEFSAIRGISHANVLKYIDLHVQEHQGEHCYYLVMEYCVGGTLLGLIDGTPLASPLIRQYSRQVCARVVVILTKAYIFESHLTPVVLLPSNTLSNSKRCMSAAPCCERCIL